ncbi:MAG: hypothetical protein GX587_07995 [Bacteroidales bacterium]|nr:hypothetical protein [Bacteroidales bacterium]
MKAVSYYYKAILILIAAYLLCLYSCAPSREEARIYATRVTNAIDTVIKSEQALMHSFKSNDSVQVSKAGEAFLSVVNNSLDSLEAIGTYYDNSQLKLKAFQLLRVYKKLANNDYKAMMAIVSLEHSDYTIEKEEELLALQNKSDMEVNSRIAEFLNVRAKFEEENGLEPE